jgi:hypothetical protein
MERHDTRIPTQLLSPSPNGDRACLRAGSSNMHQIQANEIRMVKTRKDTRCPITHPVVTDFQQPVFEQDLRRSRPTRIFELYGDSRSAQPCFVTFWVSTFGL